jgi:hypothetical protein
MALKVWRSVALVCERGLRPRQICRARVHLARRPLRSVMARGDQTQRLAERLLVTFGSF